MKMALTLNELVLEDVRSAVGFFSEFGHTSNVNVGFPCPELHCIKIVPQNKVLSSYTLSKSLDCCLFWPDRQINNISLTRMLICLVSHALCLLIRPAMLLPAL